MNIFCRLICVKSEVRLSSNIGRFICRILSGFQPMTVFNSEMLYRSTGARSFLGTARSRPPSLHPLACLTNCSFRTILATALTFSPGAAVAGGTCLLHPQPFKLQSDTVRWSIKINAGGECIQGLRWSTTMIDAIAITEQPKAGRLVIQGPSFRYFSDPGARGTDSFILSISGTSLHVKGTSSIEVDVVSQ
jgi:hypothetical protein